MWKYNGNVIHSGRPWEHDSGKWYPRTWSRMSNTEKEAIGLVWEDDPVVEPYDDRFYYSANNPKALEDVNSVDENGDPVLDENGDPVVQQGLKSQWIARTKQTANSLLSSTDWYVIRESETSVAMPADVQTYRAAVRTASGTIETAISACTTLDEFIAMHQTPVDADGNPTGKAPIHDWPDAL